MGAPSLYIVIKSLDKHSLCAAPDSVLKDQTGTFKETEIRVRAELSSAVMTTNGFALEIH